MAIINGYVTDVRQAPLAGRMPRILFRLDREAVTGSHVLTTAPVEATIDAATGAFTVQIVSTDLILPPTTRYIVSVDWDAGQSIDVFTGLRIPEGIVNFTDILAASGAPVTGGIMYGFGPPPPELDNVIYLDLAGVNAVLYAPDGGSV